MRSSSPVRHLQSRAVSIAPMRSERNTRDPLLRRRRAGALLRVRIAAEVAWTYVRVRRLLRRHEIAQVVDLLRADADDRLEPETARSLGRRLDRPIGRTLALVPGDSRCLVRSLVLLRMMARRGARCELSIGARSETEFTAHAWVEHGGHPVLPTLGYAPLTTI
jgi:Transglutaminase-like superfamily